MRLELSVRDGQGRVEIKIGPLEPGVAARKLADNEFPGLGNTLERITDRAEVSETDTSDGPAEFLVLELHGD